MSTPIKEMMTEMPHTVGNKASLQKARTMMSEYSCHHLPVLEGGKLVGILSSKDLNEVTLKEDAIVEDIMTEEPVTVKPDKDVFQVAMLMHERKIGSVIVAATPYSPWGIFTSTDALNYLSDKQVKKDREIASRPSPDEYNSFE